VKLQSGVVKKIRSKGATTLTPFLFFLFFVKSLGEAAVWWGEKDTQQRRHNH
jgi:hypothetical protein